MRNLLPAVILLCFVPLVRGQTADEKKETIAYLQKLQTPEGGFLAAAAPKDKKAQPGLRATSSALRALKYLGGAPTDTDSCKKFIVSCLDKDSGGFADTPGGKPDVTSTAVGMMAVVELSLPVNEYRDGVVKYLTDSAKTFEDIRIAAAGAEAAGQRPKSADAWLEEVAKLRNDDGTYGKDDSQARDTASAIVVVMRLGGRIPHIEKVEKTIWDGQRKDGAFGKAGTEDSDLETSYRVMRALHMVKEKPRDVVAIKAFIGKCRNADGGYGVAPGQPSSAQGTYFASIILFWLAK
jgi:prenyltransferase beta subunit